MKVAFRTDASTQIGSGHVMRCMALADLLCERGAECFFLCRELPGNLNRLIVDMGFTLCPLACPAHEGPLEEWSRHAAWLEVPWQQDAAETVQKLKELGTLDWMVTDHYALDARWESQVRANADKIMVIDDLADRHHQCEILLDQNYFLGYETRYRGLVPPDCHQLLGPHYALLRPDFREEREALRTRTGRVKRILVFFGGVDPTDETSKALHALRLLNRDDIVVDVIVGAANRRQEEIRRLTETLPNAHLHCQVLNMAELLAKADLALGAGGATTWERLAVGTPSLLVAVAFNQEQHAADLASRGLIAYLGRSDQVDEQVILNELRSLLAAPERLMSMTHAGMRLVDGLGATRLADMLLTCRGDS